MRANAVSLLCVLLLLMSSYSRAENMKDRIPQAEAVADVNQFFETLQRVHIDLLAKVSLEDYITLKQQTLDDIAKKLDKDGKISVNDLAYILSYAAAFFHDGHTSVWWDVKPDESNTEGKRFPPFLLHYDNGRFVVAASSNKDIEGLEIISVNGKPILGFLRPILDRCSGETLAFKAACFTGRQSFWYCFSNLCGSAESLTIRLRDAKGKESEQKVETVSFADFRKLKDKRLQQLRQQIKQGTQVHFLDSGRIAHLIYPAFNESEDERKKIEGIFQEIKDRKSQTLIIDIRCNGGGASTMGDFIFSYLSEGKLLQDSKTRVKVSADILSPSHIKIFERLGASDIGGKFIGYLQKKYAGLEGIIVNARDDDFDEITRAILGEGKPVSKPNAFFSGDVFLLVDNGTFSAASGFATEFRDYNAGKILGYETGGVPISFGQAYGFELENSKIFCSVSWMQYFPAKPRPGDDEHGVLPDIPMNDKRLRPYQKEDDPVLAFTLDHIKKTRKSH